MWQPVKICQSLKQYYYLLVDIQLHSFARYNLEYKKAFSVRRSENPKNPFSDPFQIKFHVSMYRQQGSAI